MTRRPLAALARLRVVPVVPADRQDGPEVVPRLVRERAPGGFADVEDVMPPAERAEIALRYKRPAGFEPATLNAGRSRSVRRPGATS
ncbi:hypothetical protein MF672_018760 [Actinomadura sp. ATCC 31491]|uniref:Uncharacterized protein n=1 Tax=Actinomadura luzonensis TaxID=2805427 RepID=A0ABT0FU77_9ACTN|nr:hypothetical protein [Actinomadura luzonensis]MCK2215819.1 hypothetical protein [Actinomadura luzonensis]